MRPFYRRHPFPSTQGDHQPYLILGSTASPADLMTSNTHPSYLLSPFEFTTHHEPKDFRSIDEAKHHTGEQHFRSDYANDALLTSYSTGGKSTKDAAAALRIGSPFMKRKRMDPQRFLLNVADGSVWRFRTLGQSIESWSARLEEVSNCSWRSWGRTCYTFGSLLWSEPSAFVDNAISNRSMVAFSAHFSTSFAILDEKLHVQQKCGYEKTKVLTKTFIIAFSKHGVSNKTSIQHKQKT